MVNKTLELTGGYNADLKSFGFNINFNHAEFVGSEAPAPQLNVRLEN
jgi:hypothetical protein